MLKKMILKFYWFIYDEFFFVIHAIGNYFNKPMQHFLSLLNVNDTNKTIDKILKEKSSIARFGDGEFYVIWGGGNDFQSPNHKLQIKLKEVLNDPLDNLLIGIPSSWKYRNNLTHKAKMFYSKFLYKNFEKLSNTLDLKREYFDTQFTRFYIDYKDKSKSVAVLKEIKKIWYCRKVFIIEGVFTRMGVGNNLFSDALEVKRLIGPSKNAFERYDMLLKTALEIIPKNYLVLIALGMTATCLAYDMAKCGYQAIDLGHLDVEYEWMKLGVKTKVPLPNRFVNEMNNYNGMHDIQDDTYSRQIVKVIR